MFENESLGENVEAVAQPQNNPASPDTGEASDGNTPYTGEASEQNPAGERANGTPPSDKGGKVQSAEENSKYAAARREAEARARAAEGRMLGLARRHGFNSVDEFERHLEMQKQEELGKRFFDTFGVDAKEAAPVLNDMVSNHPDVLAARQLAAKSREENAKLYVERELAEVQKFDPEIKSFDDLRSHDKFPEMERLLKSNYSISDAYKLANFDAISKKGAEAAAQRALNSAESKSHLKPHGGTGGDAVVVPEDVKEQYRFFNKGITDEEIAKDYEKSIKRKD